MRLARDEASRRLDAAIHGVLCTIHPDRGPDPVPVVFAVHRDQIGIPVDTVKPKTATRLRREANLALDPRASLLVERWDPDDWSRLWWVRAHLLYVPGPDPRIAEALAQQLADRVRQYAERPFHHLLVFRLTALTGWAATFATAQLNSTERQAQSRADDD